MKCALAALGFINENVQYNKKVIVDTMAKCSGDADIVVFGEAFLQGFYGATFDTEHDENVAISQEDLIIKEIAAAAKEYKINAPALYVNSFCIDKKEEYEIAKGGAALFDHGIIVQEIPAGQEDILFVVC